MEEWKEYNLGELIELNNGFAFKSKDFVTSGIPVIKIRNVKANRILLEDVSYVSMETALNIKCTPIMPSDILITMTGNRKDGSIDSWVGKVALFNHEGLYLLNQRVSAIRIKHPNIVDYRYLAYFLSSFESQLYFINHSNSSGGQANISPEIVNNYIVNLPSLQTQKRISNLIKTFDDKIELNRRINRNLEQQAQALFKAWFVDFEPFKNGEFVDSELGKIPEGWKVGNLLDIAIVFDSLRKPLSSRERNAMAKIYPYYGATSLMDYVEDFIFDGTYLLMGEDGSVVNENGHPYLQYVFGRFWVNNHAHVLQGKNGYTTEMLHCLLYKKNISSIVTGAVQAKISQTNMKKILVVIPTKDICTNFSNLIAPIYAKVRNIESENSKLSKIRDILLPRLMSGELNVNTITE